MDYISPTYNPIGPINSFYGVPRFGHSSDITDIFTAEGSLDVNKLIDYVMGSIFVAAFLLATFVLFILIVVVFKIFGRKAGILAGHPFVEDKSLEFESRPVKHNIVRALILLLTGIVIAGGGAFMSSTQQVRRVASDVRDATTGFKGVSQRVVDTADRMIEFGETSVPVRDDLLDLIDGGICKSFEGGNSNPQDDIDSTASLLAGVLSEMQNFAKNELVDIRDVFAADLTAMANKMGNTTDTTEVIANPTFYAIPAIALGILLFIGTILAWNEFGIGGYFCMQTWLIVPLFLVLIFASIVVITPIAAVLVANADFCIGNSSGTPEGTFKAVLDVFNLDNRTISALNYYIIDGCRGEYAQLTAVEDLLLQLDEGISAAKDLHALIDARQIEFEMACGGQSGSLDSLQTTIASAIDAFEETKEIGDSTTDFLTCQDINSIWVDIAHDAVCTSAPSALTWIFYSLTAVYAAGVFVYLLRGALLPSIDIQDQYKDEPTFTDDEIMNQEVRHHSAPSLTDNEIMHNEVRHHHY